MAIIEPETDLNLTYPLQPSSNPSTLDDSTSGVPSVLVGLLIPQLVCTLFLLARICSRLLLLRKWFLDDTLILAAWLFSTAVCTVYSIAVTTPNLNSTILLSKSSGNTTYSLTTYLGLIFYQLTLLLTKLSILSFYLRMFSSRPIERRLALLTIALVIAYGIPLLTLSVLQCRPPDASPFFFSPIQHSGSTKCLSFTPLLIASASLHTATDAWLIGLIAPVVARLAVPQGQKLALATVLSLGVFVIAASLTRLELSLHAASRDRVANTLAFFVMTVLECDVALLCACAPTLRPVLARCWPVVMGDGERERRLRRQRRRRRRLRRRRTEGGSAEAEEEEEEGSVNLTVVSYHGYPWAPASATAEGADERRREDNAPPAAKMAIPVPPPPAAFPSILRTPTTLSLRSFMSSMAPRSRGQTASTRDVDREVLLGDETMEGKRRSSVGFEGYYDQYLGYGYGEEKRRSRMARDSMVGRHGAWADSQESFVLGVNDPASPTRLSPVSYASGMPAAIDPAQMKTESKEEKEQSWTLA